MSNKCTEQVSRRELIRAGAAAVGGAALISASVMATPAQAQSAKVSQLTAGYQNHPSSGQSCSNCGFFKPATSCTIVDGSVTPTGWCKLYQKKS
jgi:hypothetical protein